MDPFAPLVDALRGDPRVRLVYAFGSRVHGNPRPESDADLGVLFAERPALDQELDLRARLAGIEPRVDLVVLNGAGVVLAWEVVTGGRCLFARDDREHAEYEIRVIGLFQDFQPMLRVQREYRRARQEERRRGAARRSGP